jgi:hypothetical protein
MVVFGGVIEEEGGAEQRLGRGWGDSRWGWRGIGKATLSATRM